MSDNNCIGYEYELIYLSIHLFIYDFISIFLMRRNTDQIILLIFIHQIIQYFMFDRYYQDIVTLISFIKNR